MKHTKTNCSSHDIFLSGIGLQCGNCMATDYRDYDEPKPYVIFSKTERLFWSNTYGWTDFWIADYFTEKEKNILNLPIGGEWRKGK